GFFSVEIVVNPHALSVAPRTDLCEEKLCTRSAHRASSALAAHADHLIPVVDQLIDLDLPFVERERPEPIVLEEGLDLFVAAIDAESRDPGWRRIPDDLRRPDAFADDSVNSTSVEGFEPAPGRLHVLLRHRLLRQPGGLEGFGPVGVSP